MTDTGPHAPPDADAAAPAATASTTVTATTPAAAQPVPWAVQMSGICKRFGAVLANADVDLCVAAGTVHAIVGENGAGKSTLMSVLYGFCQPDRGAIALFGRTVAIGHPQQAIAHGVGMVHQHFMLVERFTALENVMLGAEPHWLLRRAAAQARAKLQELMRATGLQLRLDAPVAELTVGERQRLEILKALYRGAKILILDEPTAVLTPQEAGQLFAVLRLLRARGSTVLLITHKLREVMALCDRVTVLRAARVVLELPVAQATIAGLAQAMVGRKPAITGPRGQVERAAGSAGRDGEAAEPAEATKAAPEPLLQASGLLVRDALGVPRLQDLNLCLHAGEIVGVAGVAGNGQSELLDVLSGLLAPQAGCLQLGGRRFAAPRHWLDPLTARALGLAHVPENRQQRALVPGFAAWEAAALGYDGRPEYGRRGWLDRGAMRAAAARMMERFDVRPRNVQLRCAAFSGGNQQKLVLARELGQAPRVLLVGQPTRGVDIGAIDFIYAQLRALRAAGCALLLVSSELDEILALADRVLVLHRGRVSGELAVAGCTEAGLGLLMAGGAQ